MNNIKLRCWDTERKEWNTSWIIQPDAAYRNLSDFGEGKSTEKLEFQRYTGLKDKNGVEIAEGDICKCERSYWDASRNLIVEWFGERYGLKNPKDNVDSEVMDKESCFNVTESEREVIGNVKDNPELLEGK